jgi:hypothetical protein
VTVSSGVWIGIVFALIIVVSVAVLIWRFVVWKSGREVSDDKEDGLETDVDTDDSRNIDIDLEIESDSMRAFCIDLSGKSEDFQNIAALWHDPSEGQYPNGIDETM